jgi:hypothetical protein
MLHAYMHDVYYSCIHIKYKYAKYEYSKHWVWHSCRQTDMYVYSDRHELYTQTDMKNMPVSVCGHKTRLSQGNPFDVSSPPPSMFSRRKFGSIGKGTTSSLYITTKTSGRTRLVRGVRHSVQIKLPGWDVNHLISEGGRRLRAAAAGGLAAQSIFFLVT